MLEEQATTCCYARSDKQWIADPQGVAWETFLTHGEATDYGVTGAVGRLLRSETELADCCAPASDASSCCTPSIPDARATACCAPAAA